ncbi:hypothetical protein RI129_010019 [Pyrocoelia pectoralis]|uniref:Uncharacterized protein n=1 Tax=Pyrocoelia pectoralis TaxID=417401 RepID=A0AAN7V5V7_9COLE
MKAFLLYCLIIATVSTFSYGGILSSVEDYFWRDYTGILPNDALPGGIDSNGSTTYIAQISIPSLWDPTRSTVDVLPAILQAGAIIVYAPYNATVVYRSASNSSVKILCSSNPRDYQWYSTTEMLSPFHKYVIVGYEASSPLYAGRAVIHNETVTGKIFANDRDAGLIVAHNGTQTHQYSYKVLTYAP